MVFFSLGFRAFYSKFMIKIRHQIKIWMVIAIWTFGIFLLFFAKYTSIFSFVLISCMMIGVGCTLGTLAVLGFLKCFPANLFSGYSTGTGVSGILAAVLYLYMKFDQFSFDSILLVMMLFYPFYGLGFYFVINIRKKLEEKIHLTEILQETDIEALKNSTLSELETEDHSKTQTTILRSDSQNLAENFPDSESNKETVDSKTGVQEKNKKSMMEEENLTPTDLDLEQREAQINEVISLKNLKEVHKILFWEFFLFFAMYFFEYFSITVLAEKSAQHFEKLPPTGYFAFLARSKPYFFEISQFLYQFGLSLTRSSLDVIKIKKISYIVVALGGVCLVLFLQVFTNYFFSLGVVYGLYFMVGILGGFSYCNLMVTIYEKENLPKKYKVHEFFFIYCGCNCKYYFILN